MAHFFRLFIFVSWHHTWPYGQLLLVSLLIRKETAKIRLLLLLLLETVKLLLLHLQSLLLLASLFVIANYFELVNIFNQVFV